MQDYQTQLVVDLKIANNISDLFQVDLMFCPFDGYFHKSVCV